MKRKLRYIAIAVIFLAGLCVLLYPTVSQYRNTQVQSEAVAAYDASVAQMTPTDFTAAWEAVDAYNQELAASGVLDLLPSQEETARYNALLDPSGTGVMGHIEIQKLGVDLPVYHGVDEGTLQAGIGHIPGTSLPGGGESTHAVLSGHRGLPTAHLFTDLDQLEEGDTFVLHVLDRSMAYQVDQIRVVEPNQVDDLAIVSGQDYCTLVTCTPYGINTHRLLVRGHRVPYGNGGYVPTDAVKVDSALVSSVLTVISFVVVLIVVAWREQQKRRNVLGSELAASNRLGGTADAMLPDFWHVGELDGFFDLTVLGHPYLLCGLLAPLISQGFGIPRHAYTSSGHNGCNARA